MANGVLKTGPDQKVKEILNVLPPDIREIINANKSSIKSELWSKTGDEIYTVFKTVEDRDRIVEAIDYINKVRAAGGLKGDKEPLPSLPYKKPEPKLRSLTFSEEKLKNTKGWDIKTELFNETEEVESTPNPKAEERSVSSSTVSAPVSSVSETKSSDLIKQMPAGIEIAQDKIIELKDKYIKKLRSNAPGKEKAKPDDTVNFIITELNDGLMSKESDPSHLTANQVKELKRFTLDLMGNDKFGYSNLQRDKLRRLVNPDIINH